METASGNDAGAARARRAYLLYVTLAILFGIWLRWPALYAGFFSDDYVQPAMRAGVYPAPREPLDLFSFAAGSADDNAMLQRYGALPWWTAPNLRLAMMRPLSSALILLDDELFGTNALPYHVHSLIWWTLMMVAAAALLRRLFTTPIASLAVLIFALEEGHTLPLVWLANRGALVAMFFGIVGLLLHVHARETPSARATWGAFACFCVALLSGEWAFPLLGYVLAYELLHRQEPLRERLLALWPAALPGGVFLVVRSRLQFGALNSGIYIDPITEPAAFFVAALQRIPVFFADLFFSVPAVWWGAGTPWRDRILGFVLGSVPPKLWLALPGWHFWHVLLGVIAMLATVVTLRAGLRDRPREERRQIRWLLAGAFVSLVPMVASFPTSRLVLPASLASSAAAAIVMLRFAEIVRRQWTSARRRAWLSAGVVALVAYFQVWEAGRTSYGETRSLASAFGAIHDWAEHARIDDRTVAGQAVMLIGGLEHSTTIFLPWMRWRAGRPIPRAHQVLTAAPFAHDVYRPAPNVLELSVLGGSMLTADLERLYRADRFPIALGDVFRTPEFTAEVTRLRGGKPQSVRFTFRKPVDDASYLFLYPSPEGMWRARLPEVGQRFRFRVAGIPNTAFAKLVRNEPDPGQRCVGAPPPLDECRIGFAYADCRAANGATVGRADAEPVFACHGFGDCRWFTGGCLAEGFVASPCSATNLCCVDGWPFYADDFPSQAPVSFGLHGLLGAFGLQPWAAPETEAFDVIIDPSLRSTTPLVRCSAEDAGAGGPCGLGHLDVAPPQQSSLRFSFWPARLDDGHMLMTEVIDGRDGILRARVCKVPLRPRLGYLGEPQTCPVPARPVCASRGTIVLNRFPLEASRLPLMASRVRAWFEDGTRVDAEF